MRVQYGRVAGNDGGNGLFALARKILAGAREPQDEPAQHVDLKDGIGRAVRHAKSSRVSARDLVEKAARAIAVVEGTLAATDAIDAALGEMQDVVSHALAAQDVNARQLCAQRYAALIGRIDATVAQSSFDGTNLIDLSRDNIELVSPVGGRPHHAISHIVLVTGERGLNLKSPHSGFRDDAEIEAAGHTLMRARARLIKAADTFLNQASCLAPLLEGDSAAA
jgi:hypothetical protein